MWGVIFGYFWALKGAHGFGDVQSGFSRCGKDKIGCGGDEIEW